MSLSAPFVHRPVGTTLLTIALVMAGAISFRLSSATPSSYASASSSSQSAIPTASRGR